MSNEGHPTNELGDPMRNHAVLIPSLILLSIAATASHAGAQDRGVKPDRSQWVEAKDETKAGKAEIKAEAKADKAEFKPEKIADKSMVKRAQKADKGELKTATKAEKAAAKSDGKADKGRIKLDAKNGA
jgi:hypothetical protein